MVTATLIYTKQFTSGTLEGLTAPCSITFGAFDAALAHAKAFNIQVGRTGSDVLTGTKWVIVAVEVRRNNPPSPADAFEATLAEPIVEKSMEEWNAALDAMEAAR